VEKGDVSRSSAHPHFFRSESHGPFSLAAFFVFQFHLLVIFKDRRLDFQSSSTLILQVRRSPQLDFTSVSLMSAAETSQGGKNHFWNSRAKHAIIKRISFRQD
jgi:hypothetical protein